MENQNKRSFQRSNASAGRSRADNSRPIRTTASYMHAAKTETEPVAEENSRRSKKAKRSRRRAQNENVTKKPFPWKKVLIGAGVLVIVLAILALIFGTEEKVIHQMPKVTPPETAEESV